MFETERFEQTLRTHLHRMAQPHRLDRTATKHRTGQHRHRIGVVQKPGVRRNLFDVVRKIQHHRNRPKRPENPPDPERIRNRLPQTELLRNFKINHRRRFISANLNRVDHEIRPAQRFLPRLNPEMGRDGRPAIHIVVDRVENELRLPEPFAIDVVQRKMRTLQRLTAHAVPEHVPGKHRTARPHKCDFNHINIPVLDCFFPGTDY